MLTCPEGDVSRVVLVQSLLHRDTTVGPDQCLDEAAGISHSLFSRQLKQLDNQHVSWTRLYLLPDRFWRELWLLIADRRGFARVTTQVAILTDDAGGVQ